MFVVFENTRRAIKLDDFDEIALGMDSGKWYVVAKKYIKYADGVSVCYIKGFKSGEKEEAEDLYDELQEAWMNGDNIFTIED